MHLAITFLVMLAVLAVVFMPGYVIQRSRRRRAERPASYSFEPTPATGEPDPLPPHLLAALRVEGFLNEEERIDAEAAAQTRADLSVLDDVMLRIRGAGDAAVGNLITGGTYVQLCEPEA